MKQKHILAALLAAAVLPAQAASDLTNPLNTYVGNSQANFPAQPAFLATSRLDVSFVWGGGAGAWERIVFFDTTAVTPDVPGAKFDFENRGDNGRNYLRTVETDYHKKDFTAFVTVKRPAPLGTNRRSVFFGLGTGAVGPSFKRPDYGTGNAAAYVELQNGYDNAARFVIGNSINTEVGYGGMTQVSSDAIRMRMQYNSTARTVTYTLDYDYNGTFEAQQTLPTFSVGTQAAEWYAGDRASIFFGGDRSVVFTDLVITTTQAPAPPPTGLQLASVGDATVTISWPAGVTGATYSVYRSAISGDFGSPAVPIATGLTTTTYTDNTGLTNGIPYFYVVTQTNPGSLESAFSNQITATPVAGVLPPTEVIALNSGNQAVLVDWADLVSPFDTYKLYRSTDGGTSFSELATGLTASRYLDQAVTNGSTYIYKVTAVLGGNESVDSAPAQAIPNALEVFVDFNASAVNSGRGVLAAGTGNTWNNVGGGTSVATSKLNDSSGAVSALGIAGGSNFGAYNGFGGANVGGNPVTLVENYNLMLDYRFSDGFGNIRTYTFSGLPSNRTYDLYLFGYGAGGDQNAGFKVGEIGKQTRNPVGLTTLTESRHYVTFTVVSGVDGSFSFSWSGPGNLGMIDAEPGNGSGFNGFQLVENPTAVLQPLNLTATGTPTAVDLNWDDVVGATSYHVYRSVTPASDYTLLADSVTTSDYSDTTAVPGTAYYYVVKALNGTVESFSSAEASGTRELPAIIDNDSDGLSDEDEALIGTDPNDASDFYVTKTSTITPNAGNYDVSFVINGAEGDYVIERSTTLAEGSWVEIPASKVAWTWTTGVLDNLTLSAPALTPDPGGKEFFRAKGVAPATP